MRRTGHGKLPQCTQPHQWTHQCKLRHFIRFLCTSGCTPSAQGEGKRSRKERLHVQHRALCACTGRIAACTFGQQLLGHFLSRGAPDGAGIPPACSQTLHDASTRSCSRQNASVEQAHSPPTAAPGTQRRTAGSGRLQHAGSSGQQGRVCLVLKKKEEAGSHRSSRLGVALALPPQRGWRGRHDACGLLLLLPRHPPPQPPRAGPSPNLTRTS